MTAANPFAWPEDSRITTLRARAEAAETTLATIRADLRDLCAAAERRRGLPTGGLVSARAIAAVLATTEGNDHE